MKSRNSHCGIIAMNGAGVSRCDRSPIFHSLPATRSSAPSSSLCGRFRNRWSIPSWSRISMIVGPFGLGAMAADHPALDVITITDRQGIEPFAEFGIILLLFAIGLELSFRRLAAMRRAIFGIGAAEMLLGTVLIGGGLWALG